MAAKLEFDLAQEHGWRMGFANLLDKENGTWWHTKTWWVQILF